MADTSLLDRLLETLEVLGQTAGEGTGGTDTGQTAGEGTGGTDTGQTAGGGTGGTDTGETPVPHHKPAFADAISRELERERRTTAVRSLRDDPIVQQFRTELADGLIRVDTVQQLLGLIDRVVQRVLV